MTWMPKLFRRMRFGEPIVVVSGLPRSGTSMAMKMLEAGGLSTVQDGIRTADEDNPKGYYEDERVKDLHQDVDRTWVRDSRGKAIKIISFLLTHLPEDNNYKIIFMRRPFEEVLASQTKMLQRRGETNDTSDEHMIEVYKDHLWKVNRLLKRKPCFEYLDVEYRSVLENPRQEADRMCAFLGDTLDAEKMAAMVDSKLYRNRSR